MLFKKEREKERKGEKSVHSSMKGETEVCWAWKVSAAIVGHSHSHMICLLSLCYLLRARIITKLTPNCQVENSPTLQMISTNSMSPGKTPWISPLDQSPVKICPPIFCLLHWPAAPWKKGVSATLDPSPAQCSGTLLHSFNECSLCSSYVMGSVPGTGILWDTRQKKPSLLHSI